jgi:hypothetical protein
MCLTKHHAIKRCVLLNYAPSHDEVLEKWRYMTPLIKINTRWKWVVSFIPQPLYCRSKISRYPLDRRLCGPQSRSRRGGEEKKSHHYPFREMNPNRSAWKLADVLTELRRLLHVHGTRLFICFLVHKMAFSQLHNTHSVELGEGRCMND